MNKYHLHSATGTICGTVWCVAGAVDNSMLYVTFGVLWFVHSIWAGVIADRKEGER